MENRPHFPSRAVITAGMPYGNKDLHFGHIGGVFVHADVFARFLRDRIGDENVIFVSGTDCYGSPIVEHYRQMIDDGAFDEDIEDFVRGNHDKQQEVLDRYLIGIDLFAASSFTNSHEIHKSVCADILKTLYAHGYLVEESRLQFWDPVRHVFLNGRQVEGRCPVEGCTSEKAYADECSLGHQIDPQDVIDPKSTLSGECPELREAANWYLDLERFRAHLDAWVTRAEKRPGARAFVAASLREFLEPPAVFVLDKHMDEVRSMAASLPPFTEHESKSKSTRLVFDSLAERERACRVLTERAIRFRTGKTLVPFRLTGNLEWGLEAPDLGKLRNVTFWVWPESLIAPISFVQAYLENVGRDRAEWPKWWCSKECEIFQFIGADNLYFYGLAEIALFLGMQGEAPAADPPEGALQLPHLVVNNHILFFDKKASSSGKIRPPMAQDLLEYYTPEQLRAHFLSLGLGLRSVGFKPKFLNPDAGEKDGDPVLQEGNLLSNVFNRAIRSCFYAAQKYFDGRIPVGAVGNQTIAAAKTAILEFERHMHSHEFHKAMATFDRYVRHMNKYWAQGSRRTSGEADDRMRQVLIDTFHMVRTASVLAHSIAPVGTEMVREYLRVGKEFFRWDRVFDTVYDFMEDPKTHTLKFLEPRVDFFEKHERQFS